MATLTINTTSAQDARILAAFSDRFGEPATGAMVKQWLIDHLKREVFNYERKVAREAADSGVSEIDPS